MGRESERSWLPFVPSSIFILVCISLSLNLIYSWVQGYLTDCVFLISSHYLAQTSLNRFL